MDIRKKKRIFKPSLSFSHQSFSMKSFVICCSFVVFLLLLSRDFKAGSGSFRPARAIMANLSVFSSSPSSSVNNSIQQDLSAQDQSSVDSSSSNGLTPEYRIENRVLFTDHVLVILSANGNSARNLLQLGGRIDCVYQSESSNYGKAERSDKEEIFNRPMLSADEYGETGTRWIIRCPYPPVNYSAGVGLKAHPNDLAGSGWELSARENQTAQSWDMVAYEATWDGEDTAAVFAKGFNLRSDKESIPDPFSCRFKLENKSDSVAFTSDAITASQEIIRCPLPPALKTNLKNNESIRVSVVRGDEEIPSMAKLHSVIKKKGGYKYELCACTMVWNQAAFIREWITYHAWLGVQRWFLYDNNSDDGLKEVINELNSENYNVTRHVWPWVKAQEAGFSHCVLRARDDCSWLAFFDVDEFYFFQPPRRRNINLNLGYPGPNSLRALLKNVSSTSPSVGEVRTDCYSYGPSGLKESPPKGVTVGYTCRIRSPERHKSIVRPNAVNESLLNQVHHFSLKKEFKKKNLLPSIAVINHYKYQVWDVFKAKFHRRVSTYVADWQEKQNENSRDRAPGLGTEAIEPPDWHQRFCEVWDTKLRDYIMANLADPTTGLLPWERSLQ